MGRILMMSAATTTATQPHDDMSVRERAFLTTPVIAIIAFLTVVDLFATQAILPALARSYGVSPATMGVAVNFSTFGMAFAGLACAFFPVNIDRRRWIAGALVVLAVPTALLALMPSLTLFSILRIAQGLCMATAFTLTLAYLGEACSVRAASAAFAAYITGNVASNLIGRFVSASLAEGVGLSGNFLAFAALNLAGAVLVRCVLQARVPGTPSAAISPWTVWRAHLGNRPLLAIFGLGFCILFVFLGTFTYVNFVLLRPPFALAPMTLGIVYLVFLPAVFTTPLAGRAVALFGRRYALLSGLAIAAIGLPLLILPVLAAVLAGMVLAGMVLISVGTFLAQAVATGAVGETAMHNRTAASGMYLGAYYLGGLIGTALLGQAFVLSGWPATVTGLGFALALAALCATRLPREVPTPAMSHS